MLLFLFFFQAERTFPYTPDLINEASKHRTSTLKVKTFGFSAEEVAEEIRFRIHQVIDWLIYYQFFKKMFYFLLFTIIKKAATTRFTPAWSNYGPDGICAARETILHNSSLVDHKQRQPCITRHGELMEESLGLRSIPSEDLFENAMILGRK